MSDVIDIIHNYRLIRDRLRCPPNAVIDKGINLRLKRIPPQPAKIIPPKKVLECRVTIRIIPKPPIEPVIPRIVKLSSINKAVCRHFSIPMSMIKGASRKPRDVLPRHIIFYLACLHTGLSMPRIARKVGRKDHTTVLHGRRRISELILADDALASTVKLIEYLVLAGYYDTNDDIPRSPMAAINQSSMAQQGQASLSRS